MSMTRKLGWTGGARRWALPLAIVLAFAGTGLAASKKDRDICTDNAADDKERFAACNRIVADKTESGHRRAEAYLHRSRVRGAALRALNTDIADSAKDDLNIADLDEAIRLKPDYALAYNQRGLVYIFKRDYDRAIADITEALRLDPKPPLYFNNRGWAYLFKKHFDLAIADFDASLRIEPDDRWVYNHRGLAYHGKGDFDRAIADLTATLRLRPSDDVFVERGNAYRDKGDLKRAIADFDEAIRLDPKRGEAYVRRGEAHQAAGNPDRAIADFDEAIRRYPEYAFAYTFRGFAYERSGDRARAVADFNKAAELTAKNPNSLVAHLTRGDLHRMKGELERAAGEYAAVVRIDPKFAKLVERRMATAGASQAGAQPEPSSAPTAAGTTASADDYARCNIATKNADELIAACTRLIDSKKLKGTNLVYAHNNRGIGFERKGDSERALVEYGRAIGFDENYAGALINRAHLLLKQKELDRARADYDAALAKDSKLVQAYVGRAGVWTEKGETDRAIADYEAALKLSPNNAEIKSALATARAAKQAVKVEPDRPGAAAGQPSEPRQASGPQSDLRTCATGGRRQDIRAACTRLIEAGKGGDNFLALLHATRHIDYVNDNEWSKALPDIDAALGYDPGNAAFHLLRGITLRRLAQEERAKRAFALASRLDSNMAVEHLDEDKLTKIVKAVWADLKKEVERIETESKRPAERTPGKAPAAAAGGADALAWKLIKDTNDPETLRAFVREFPDSPLSREAEARIATLAGKAASTEQKPK
jgi:tetratricopeptide (TPR) repeat protein